MTQAPSKRVGLSQDKFTEVKRLLEGKSVAEVSRLSGLSETTVRRIKRSESLAEYKGYIAASNGSKQFNEDEFEKSLNRIEKNKEKYEFEQPSSVFLFEPIEAKDTPSVFGVFLTFMLFVGIAFLAWFISVK